MSPADGAQVVARVEIEDGEAEALVAIEFTVSNFSLAEPKGCAGKAGCGHVHVLVDGADCNDQEDDGTILPFNNEGAASPIDAELHYCPGGPAAIEGSHAVTLELFGDDEGAIVDAQGARISDSIDVVATLEADGGAGGESTGGRGGAGGAAGTGGRGGSGGAGAAGGTGGGSGGTAGGGTGGAGGSSGGGGTGG